ncbi:permease prefix domain 1-containing protein [Micromonospora psammae]|uniref:permease prefix domain 1-containing protein n=1 Tax=Micromonospora sp. CPCC 205556 TaxID=3122398 RepID=UPI002FF33F70
MSSLTDRYLAATLRAVPAPRRAEIATELRASIEDMVEDRSAGGQDTAIAEREVLTELGNPAQLAARYADRRLQLIGPTYYLAWERLLKLLLSFVPATVGVVVGLVEATTADNAGGAIGAGIVTALQVAVQIAFWVTLVFAVLERTGTSLDLPEWSVDQLTEGPVERDVRLTDTCASIAMLALVAAYLPWQHFQSFIDDDAGRNIPIIDPALWRSWLPALIAVLLASMVFEAVKYRTGRWTWRLFAVKAALDLAFAAPVMWLLHTDRLLNPALVRRFDWLRDGDNLATVTTVAVVGVALIVIWGLVDSAVRTYRSTR